MDLVLAGAAQLTASVAALEGGHQVEQESQMGGWGGCHVSRHSNGAGYGGHEHWYTQCCAKELSLDGMLSGRQIWYHHRCQRRQPFEMLAPGGAAAVARTCGSAPMEPPLSGPGHSLPSSRARGPTGRLLFRSKRGRRGKCQPASKSSAASSASVRRPLAAHHPVAPLGPLASSAPAPPIPMRGAAVVGLLPAASCAPAPAEQKGSGCGARLGNWHARES